MKIGFNTMCLNEYSFLEVLEFAGNSGFASVEVPCTPAGLQGIRHLNVEEAKTKKNEIKEAFDKWGVGISCISYYANPLVSDELSRSFSDYISLMIDACSELDIPAISTFTGYNGAMTIEDNIKAFAGVFRPLLKKARDCNVKILLENTPFMGGYDFGGNFAYSPELWDSIFQEVSDENLGLNFDPSHLFWMGIDYQLSFSLFSERVFHVQAKDSEILVEKLRTSGIYGSNWFRYRLPGMGSLDWKGLFSGFYEMGYDGVVSIENEDVFWWTNIEKARKGLILARKNLEHLLV